MSVYARHMGTTPQTEAIPGREAEMERNDAGGYGFTLDTCAKLDRFLILGTEGGTYYVREREHTIRASKALSQALAEDGARTLARVVEVSHAGRGIKNDPAIFALAVCLKQGSLEVRREAALAVPKVCRTGTHLFQLAACIESLGGWGRVAKRGVAEWYTKKPSEGLAYQLVKYRQRDGWTHRDILRITHPSAKGPNADLLCYAVGKPVETGQRMIEGFLKVQAETDPKAVASLIREYRLPREALSPDSLKSAHVWEALLEDMPLTAMIRNLATMTRIGLLAPLSEGTGKVVSELGNAERLKSSRVHPMTLFVALKTYASGVGVRNYKTTWEPVQKIVDALDGAFYSSFGNVEPTGKRMLIGVDVSGSMSERVAGIPNLSALEAAAAQALVVYRTEPNVQLCGWDTAYHELRISDRMRLDDVMHSLRLGGGTDASIPYAYASQVGLGLDAFVILTDNETWAGQTHAAQALGTYRRKFGPAKNVNVAAAASGTSVGDPADGGTLQVVGFDPTVPQAIREFVA